MRAGILYRYLWRETALAWLAVTGALLAIMMSTRLASVLNFAAKGVVPKDLLLQLTGLQSLRYLVILMPVSLLLAIMLALGRMYSDNEVPAMLVCGQRLRALYRPFVTLSVLLALVTAALALVVGPWAGREADYLVKDGHRLLQLNPFEASRFVTLYNGRAVFYTTSVDAQGAQLGAVFGQVREPDGNALITATRGDQRVDPASGERSIKLHDGWRYVGVPGRRSYNVVHFDTLTLRLSPPPFIYVNQQRQLARTSELLASRDPADRAELAARIAAPVSLLVLALLAVPLSQIKPRRSRYSKVVLGVLAYIAYVNLIGIGQHWIARGNVPAVLGLWWVHGVALAAALWLIMRQHGWRPGRAARAP
ncbi:MAG: LPS export ABC transporter permease LptF [Gammaproteobacteria bacterium]|nr:LPS export ABC transporter permease LptF [Gammaproteobacteria bacterium]